MARRSAIGAAVLALAIACAACTACSAGRSPPGPASAGDAGPGVITVGSFDFPESVLLAHLYAGALSARGYPVRVLPDLGSRELVEPALMTGLVQLVPEYTGSALEFVSLGRAHATADVAATAAALANWMAARGIVTARPAAAQDANAIVVTGATARRGSNAEVGGATAIALDVKRATAHDRSLIIPLILLVVFVILGLLLRALVAPLILTATVVLSFAAALGVSAFFFNHVFGFGGADTSFPLFVFVFLVALGIDYNIFLMTRVREEALKRDARHGAIVGLAATGGVITSAGFVLAGTFAVLATIPSTELTEIGFAVAFGILLDTIVVRSVLVTALNLDVGRWMWWPSKLAQKPDPAPDELSRERAAATVPS